ncbi:PQQ-binding-like beta-propeller repeat protein [Marivivens marinus]|uniref:PQQ-like beta-propeller repeat protein n=1 Tax=Marivivens marinus TaxID=3110173 RepID=UPI003B84AC0A
MTINRFFSTAALSLVLLAGCAERDVILPGERVDLREGMVGAPEAAVNETRPLRLPEATTNADWTHRNGGPTHVAGHPALGSALQLAFQVNVGEGNSRRARITADPVVAGGVVYTLDSRATVTATGTNGAALWSRDVTPGYDSTSSASGGGIAFAGGTLFVATGFGELTALDAQTGAELWTQNLDAPGGSAPTVRDGLVYLVARDSRAWAIEADTGRIRWTIDGAPSASGFSGGAGVAVTDELAYFPFPSSEVLAAFPRGGLRRWSSVVTGQRLGSAASTVSDIAADPVVVGNRLYVGNSSGRVVAMEAATGDRLWTATEGAVGPVWPAGDSLFFVNDRNELVRMDSGDGSVVWRVQMPTFEEGRERRQKTLYAHFGPIIAGGRVIVASSDGALRQFDPASGALIGQVEIPGGAASNPVVAGQVLYLLNTRGQLLAFR